jgi:hypothetical protein
LNLNSSSPLPVRTIKRSKFYWGSTLEGIPRALFTIKETFNPADKKTTKGVPPIPSPEKKYWPYDGITIIGSPIDSSPANILVIGQVVTPIPSSTILGADLLSFSISHSLGYLISNPYDSPDLWEYHSISLPHSIRDQQSNTSIAHLNWSDPSSPSSIPHSSSFLPLPSSSGSSGLPSQIVNRDLSLPMMRQSISSAPMTKAVPPPLNMISFKSGNFK